MVNLSITKVKSEFVPIFTQLAKVAKAEYKITNEPKTAKKSTKKAQKKPSKKLLEAIAQIERGEVIEFKDIDEYLAKIDE